MYRPTRRCISPASLTLRESSKKSLTCGLSPGCFTVRRPVVVGVDSSWEVSCEDGILFTVCKTGPLYITQQSQLHPLPGYGLALQWQVCVHHETTIGCRPGFRCPSDCRGPFMDTRQAKTRTCRRNILLFWRPVDDGNVQPVRMFIGANHGELDVYFSARRVA